MAIGSSPSAALTSLLALAGSPPPSRGGRGSFLLLVKCCTVCSCYDVSILLRDVRTVSQFSLVKGCSAHCDTCHWHSCKRFCWCLWEVGSRTPPPRPKYHNLQMHESCVYSGVCTQPPHAPVCSSHLYSQFLCSASARYAVAAPCGLGSDSRQKPVCALLIVTPSTLADICRPVGAEADCT